VTLNSANHGQRSNCELAGLDENTGVVFAFINSVSSKENKSCVCCKTFAKRILLDFLGMFFAKKAEFRCKCFPPKQWLIAVITAIMKIINVDCSIGVVVERLQKSWVFFVTRS